METLTKMKLKQLICISFFALSHSTFAANLQCKKDYETVISKNIIEVSTAFNSGNLRYIESKTDSSLIITLEERMLIKIYWNLQPILLEKRI